MNPILENLFWVISRQNESNVVDAIKAVRREINDPEFNLHEGLEEMPSSNFLFFAIHKVTNMSFLNVLWMNSLQYDLFFMLEKKQQRMLFSLLCNKDYEEIIKTVLSFFKLYDKKIETLTSGYGLNNKSSPFYWLLTNKKITLLKEMADSYQNKSKFYADLYSCNVRALIKDELIINYLMEVRYPFYLYPDLYSPVEYNSARLFNNAEFNERVRQTLKEHTTEKNNILSLNGLLLCVENAETHLHFMEQEILTKTDNELIIYLMGWTLGACLFVLCNNSSDNQFSLLSIIKYLVLSLPVVLIYPVYKVMMNNLARHQVKAHLFISDLEAMLNKLEKDPPSSDSFRYLSKEVFLALPESQSLVKIKSSLSALKAHLSFAKERLIKECYIPQAIDELSEDTTKASKMTY